MGTFEVKTRHGNYSVTIQLNIPLEFDSIINTTKILSKYDQQQNDMTKNLDQLEVPDNNVYWIYYMLTIGI